MWKPRGKGQFCLLAVAICVFLVAMYNALFNRVPPSSVKSGLSEAKLKTMNKILSGVNLWARNQESVTEINNEPIEDDLIIDKEGDFGGGTKSNIFRGHRIVHLDLKGAPPKVDYYGRLFPLIKKLGGTGVIIEYEDMFPYKIEEITALNKYKPEDIKRILDLAAENELLVIPLVQVFGHLEFVLKTTKFRTLRENDKSPQAVCPTNNGTGPVLYGMIDDIMELHPNIKYLHIGCDEVYILAECKRCLDLMKEKQWDKKQLFLHHVTTVARYIKKKYPQVAVLSWDDEYRQLSLELLEASRIGELIEPVVWKYTSDVKYHLNDQMWHIYAKVFKKVWIASAFKGARDPNSITTYTGFYLDNHKAWMEVVEMYSSFLSFQGIMLTGWQRFDHFSVLCELLPVSVPSLAINLVYLSSGESSLPALSNKVQKMLKCGSAPSLTQQWSSAKCMFPGSEIYETVSELPRILHSMEQIKSDSQFTGWVSNYNLDKVFSNPYQVSQVMPKLTALLVELNSFEMKISHALDEVYDNYTISEWIYTYVKPHKDELIRIIQGGKKLLERESWPRRPLEFNEL